MKQRKKKILFFMNKVLNQKALDERKSLPIWDDVVFKLNKIYENS